MVLLLDERWQELIANDPICTTTGNNNIFASKHNSYLHPATATASCFYPGPM